MNPKFPNFLSLILVLAALCLSLAATSISAQELKIPRGSKIVVRNDYGSITITGWERETIEAVATDESRASETVSVSISENLPVSNRILITAKPDKRNPQGKIKLEVKVPLYVELEPIQAESDSIIVSDIEGFVNVKTGSGDIKIVNVGSVQARTGNGNITLENINGRVDLITGNGNVSARQIQGEARIISVNAKINISCVKGRIEVSDTSSQTWLTGVEGDVDVSTSNGKAYFIGAIRSENRYRLKTLSGVVSMAIPDETGFTATLSSYSGRIEKDFIFQNDSAFQNGKTNQRFIGKHKDGKAQIELDSFDGRVSFSKIAAGAIRTCESKIENKNE
jgi:Putative adhesin